MFFDNLDNGIVDEGFGSEFIVDEYFFEYFFGFCVLGIILWVGDVLGL